MKAINNKGFTLIEMITVLVIITILGLIAVPSVFNLISSSEDSSCDILVKNITTAGETLFEEIDFLKSELYLYDNNGKTNQLITIDNKTIEVNLQSLVSNGLLKGSSNSNRSTNSNDSIIINPKTKVDIGTCMISITKNIDEEDKTVRYIVKNISTDNNNCPIIED